MNPAVLYIPLHHFIRLENATFTPPESIKPRLCD